MKERQGDVKKEPRDIFVRKKCPNASKRENRHPQRRTHRMMEEEPKEEAATTTCNTL
jgi:hypothetical protein